jgi:hypothetical protein
MMNALPGENNLSAYFERSTEVRETLVTLTQRHQARSIDPGSSYIDRVTDVRFTPQTGLFTGTWIKNDWVETQTVPRLNSLRLPIKGLVVRLPESLGSKGVGFVRVPVKKTEIDSFGRQKIRNLLESVSVTLSPK